MFSSFLSLSLSEFAPFFVYYTSAFGLPHLLLFGFALPQRRMALTRLRTRARSSCLRKRTEPVRGDRGTAAGESEGVSESRASSRAQASSKSHKTFKSRLWVVGEFERFHLRHVPSIHQGTRAKSLLIDACDRLTRKRKMAEA